MKKLWWHDKVMYQMYPKSFMDSNGNGIGDLRGIILKLDYLKELGIDIVWISPIYQPPLVDQGYDISDYYRVVPEFGTMEDFEGLLAEAKKRDMYIVMDLMISHCSSEHEWSQKALVDPDGECAEYFYFGKGKDGNPPSNCRSYFGGNTWEPVPGTDKYYLHTFAKEQPDLNWDNPKVKRELSDMANWWLDKGLAGFRVDAIINIKKDTSFPNYEPDEADGLMRCTKMVESMDDVGELLQELKRETFDKYQAFNIGEVLNMKEGEREALIGENGHFSAIFGFEPLSIMEGKHGQYDAKPYDLYAWRDAIVDSQLKAQGIGFEANIIENYDEPRGAFTYLPAYAQNPAGTKMLATVAVLLREIPFIYQGQEIGVRNCRMTGIEECDDLETKNQYRLALEAGFDEKAALETYYRRSRDDARAPMQWSNDENGGFTTGTPWMKLNPDYRDINIKEQQQDPDSMLSYYKKLLALKKSEAYRETLTYGRFTPAYNEEEKVFAFFREDERKRIWTGTNYGEGGVTLHVSGAAARILLTNMEEPEGEMVVGVVLEAGSSGVVEMALKPCQAVMAELCQNGICLVPVQNL